MSVSDRRTLLTSMVAAVLLHKSSFAFTKDRAPVSVEWTLSGSDLDNISDNIPYEGKAQAVDSASDNRGLPVLYILVATFAIPYLAEALVTIYQRAVSFGLVVQQDAEGRLHIQPDPAIPSDMLILKNADGVILHRIRQPRDPAPVADALRSFIK